MVDDNRVNLKVLSRILEKYGVNPDLALSGKEAISMCKNTKYQIVFMDHMMPEMDGVETMNALRDMDVKEEPIAAGVEGYLSKPLSYIDLEKTMRKYIPGENIVE